MLTRFFFLQTTFLLSFSLYAAAQPSPRLANNARATLHAERAIYFLYDWQFDSAQVHIAALKKHLPQHPASPFLEGMLLFWKHMPTSFSSEGYQQYIALVEQSLQYADAQLAQDESNIEALFFRLTNSGLLMRYYSASGQKLKAVGEAQRVYKDLKKAKEYTNSFVEFYFIVGLYNYFREAYPEKFPIYKPFAWVFTSGDKALGLQQIEKVAREGMFSVPEALNYLIIIYDRYEQESFKALTYLRQLDAKYPNNLWFAVNYARVLIENKQYAKAREVAKRLQKRGKNDFYYAVWLLLEGKIAEQDQQDLYKAYELYNAAELGLKPFAAMEMTALYRAEVYECLLRYHVDNSDNEQSKAYRKLLGEVWK